MLKDVSFGQYYPVDSFVHKLDPRFKLLCLIAYIAMIFVAANFYGLAVCAAFFLLAVAASRVPFRKIMRSVKGILFIAAFSAVLNVFFYRGETVYAEWGIFCITYEGIIFSIFLVIRLFLLVMFSSLLTYTTTPMALTDGLENLLTPLKLLRLPVREFALVMSITLRMIPTLMDETERIMNAQRARGADFESGGLIKRVRAIVPILIPLMTSALRRADELGDAMDSRCYMGTYTAGAAKRTKYKKLAFTRRDLIGLLFAGALIAGVILTKVYLGSLL